MQQPDVTSRAARRPSWRRTGRRLAVALGAGALVAGCAGAGDIAGDEPTTPAGSSASTTAESPPTSSAPSTGSGPSTDLPDGFGDGPPGEGLDRFYDQQVSWTDCGQDECADIWVPLDYADPDGSAITIKAKRQPAGDQSARRGSLFINPGGPGGSGIDYLDYISLDPSVTAVYDVVGFDPRGVARSTPVDCLTDSELDAYIASDPTPDNAAEIREFTEIWSDFTSGCEERSGPLLGHVSTVEAARDIDVLRAVVGDEKLNYFGASYGTYLGTTYAALFPDKVDRMVLDGAIDPTLDPRQSAIDQAAGFDVALTAYLKSCVSDGQCPLGSTVDRARQQVIQLFEAIDKNPLPTSSSRDVTEGLAFLGVIVPLYNEDNWSYETQALGDALDGRGDTLLFLADAYAERQPDGSYKNNGLEVQPAVNCLDHPEDETLPEIRRGESDFLAAAPVFGQVAMWWPYACSNWPVTAAEPHPDYSAKGAAPIIVVGTTRDPATPYEQAVALADILDSGVLLTRDGDGHTAYGRGNACIDETINHYFVDGTVPDDGTRC